MRPVVAAALLAGCTTIYDAQYDDRKAELEKSRTTFLDGTTSPSFVGVGVDRVFWIDTPQAAETTVLHSLDTATPGAAQIDYQFGQGESELPTNLALGDQLVVSCEGGQAFDATSSSSTAIAELDSESPCFIDGTDVYVIVNQQILKWQPMQSAGSNQVTSVAFDLNAAGINTSQIGGLGLADKTHFLYQEGINVWLLPVGGGSGQLLNDQMHPVASGGSLTFDGTGVIYDVQEGSAVYQPFGDPLPQLEVVSSMIADGGYDINFKHDDAENLAADEDASIVNRHAIYEAKSGIFALGLDTGYVTDILLDGRGDDTGFGATPFYQRPVVTAGGLMFVEDQSEEASVHPVYEVDVTSRLK